LDKDILVAKTNVIFVGKLACGGSNDKLANNILPFLNIAGEPDIAVGGTGPEGVFVEIVSLTSFFPKP